MSREIIQNLESTLLAADPSNWAARAQVIEVCQKSGLPDEAARVVLEAPFVPEEPEALVLAAQSLGLHHPDLAIDLASRALELDPANTEAFHLRAEILAAQEPVEVIPIEEEEAPAELEEVGRYYFPEPGEFPTRSAAEVAIPVTPLVAPEQLPEVTPLEFKAEPSYLPTHFTPEEELLQTRRNVVVHPVAEEPVVYDYQHPDPAVFGHTATVEEISVGATESEEGLPLAPPELCLAEQQRESERRKTALDQRDRIKAILGTVIAHVVLFLLIGLVVIAQPRLLPPEIVANTDVSSADDGPKAKKIVQQNVQPPTSSALPTPNLLATNALAPTSIPSVDLDPNDAPVDFGSTFGTGIGFGAAGAAGGNVSFFGMQSSGERFLFVLDCSISMRPHQIELRDNELEKTLLKLGNVDYHVMLFAGGGYFIEKGWGFKNDTTFFAPGDKTYRFSKKSNIDYEWDGDPKDIPTPKWIRASSANVAKSIEGVRASKQVGGTDWAVALLIAHQMKPSPDVIFFMTDGVGGNDPGPIIEINRKYGKPKINCVAMQTSAGGEEFSEVAKKTGGSYTIVDKEGKAFSGFDYMKNPEKFKGRLK